VIYFLSLITVIVILLLSLS